MAQLNFDASQVVPDFGGSEPVPAGWYHVMIDESEMKPTRAGDGARLSLRFTILDGQYSGRKVFTGLNLKNPNPVAQEIAYKQLSALCHAVGVIQVQDSQQLHGRPLKIKVKVKAAQGDYEASNDITAFKNVNEVTGESAANGAAPWSQPQPQPQPQQWAPQQAAPQFAPPAQPAPQMVQAAPAWQAPAVQQPWEQAPAVQPQAPQAPQVAQPPQAQPVAGATPPWMQNAPAAGATPPWAQPQ